MNEIGDQTYQFARDKFSEAFAQLDALIQNPCLELTSSDHQIDVLLDDEEWQEELEKMKEVFQKLKDELNDYCRQTICLGFNSSNYDLNLVKSHLAKHLQMHAPGKKFTVKRNNQYACLANDTLKFLDITSYLAPGVNYSKFLKAFDVPENKGFFCYEWFDAVEKLDHPSLPPHSAFYSTLKERNISPEEYAFCQDVWREYNMSSFKQFLTWYNDKDVGPFVKAVENLQKFYFERHIDLFKTSISVPGTARRLLFGTGRRAGASFALFDEANKDLYFTVKNNLTVVPPSFSIVITKSGKHISGTISTNRRVKLLDSTPMLSTYGPLIKKCLRVPSSAEV
jgi:hypothetical protein